MYLNGRKIISINKMPKPIQNKTVSPSKNQQSIEADSGYELGTVTVLPVTSGIDSDIQAGNIKKGVEILGVEGTYEPTGDIQDPVTVNPSTNQQTITPDEGYSGLSSVIVNAVDTTNLTPENIKKGTSILGVTGTMIDDNYSKLVDRSVKNIYEENLHDCTEIGEYAFDRCYNLTKIVIPDNILTIKNYAFTTCYKLAEIYNLSALTVTKGSSENGDLAKYALAVHTSLSEPSILTTDNNGFVFAYVNNQGYLVRYDGDLSRITLPSSFTYQNNTITSYKINKGAFEYSTITEVTIPNNVTYIDDHAFENCSRLATVNIGSGVTYIGENAFKNCTALTTITIPNNVFTIEAGAFEGCNALESMILPFIGKEYYTTSDEGNTTTFKYIFGNTVPTSLTSVEITNIDYVQPEAFKNLSNLEEIIIPDEVEYIGNSAFYGCSSLEEFEFPQSLENVGRMAFRNCTSLTSVNLASTNLTVLSDNIFENCINLVNIYFPNDITFIGKYALSNCGFTSITIPNSVTIVDKYAFDECSNLTSVTMSNNTIDVYEGTYGGCKKLKNINFGSRTVSIQKDAFVGCNFTSITIPNTITSITNGAFSECYKLVEVYNLSQVSLTTSIAANTLVIHTSSNEPTIVSDNENNGFVFAYYGSTYYLVDYIGDNTSITFPTSFTYKGNTINSTYDIISHTFEDYGFTSISIPSSVRNIEGYAFYKCNSLISLTIANGVSSIKNYAFERCSSLTSVTIPGSATNLGIHIFSNCALLETVIISNGISEIPNCAFQNCKNLESITLPATLSTIKQYAFSGCTSLASIEIPSSVTEIGQNAFENCEVLTSITIPSGVTVLSSYLFRDCTNLNSITILGNITKISTQTFQGCSSLTSFTIPGSVTTIHQDAFSTTGLTNIIIPSSVTDIKSGIFNNCKNLISATINSSQAISEKMFYGCEKLAALTLPSNTMNVLSDINAIDRTLIKAGTGYIYVNSALVNDYKSASNWNYYAGNITAIQS